MFESAFPDTPLALTRAGCARSPYEQMLAAKEPAIPDLVLDRDSWHAVKLTARSHPPATDKMRSAERRAEYAASVVSRFARDAALAEPEPPTPDADIADLADAKRAKEEVEKRLRTAREQANLRELRGDPRPFINEVKELEKELDVVDDWVRRAEYRIRDAEAKQSRFSNRFAKHWGRLSAEELAKVEQRFKELRTKVGGFLQETAVEMVEIFYLRRALESSSAPLACDPEDMPEGYAKPDAEPAEEEEVQDANIHVEGDEGTDGTAEPVEANSSHDAAEHTEPAVESESAVTLEERRVKVLALHADGMSGRAIAKTLGLHQTQVQRIIRAAEPPPENVVIRPNAPVDTPESRVIMATAPVNRDAGTIRTIRAEQTAGTP